VDVQQAEACKMHASEGNQDGNRSASEKLPVKSEKSQEVKSEKSPKVKSEKHFEVSKKHTFHV
jgi:hypothetical protein